MPMDRTSKFVVIGAITIVLVLGIALIAGFVIFMKFTPQGRAMDQELTAKEEEGKEFGKTTDQQGCITEGMTRGKKLTGINLTGEVGNRYFVKGCLRASQPTPGFCEGVPSPLRRVVDNWDERQCEKVRIPKSACQDVLKEQILFCGTK